MAIHVAMAMTLPLRLSGKTPRVSITRPAPRAILIKVKAIVSSPSLRAPTITRTGVRGRSSSESEAAAASVGGLFHTSLACDVAHWHF
jgi:hypothetical protein